MSHDRFYKKLIQSARWRRLRRAALIRQPWCEDCLQKGIHVGATEVHHITPVETAYTVSEKERLMFNPANLRPLCHKCHIEVHKAMRVNTLETHRRREREKLSAVMSLMFPDVELPDTPGG